MNKETDQIQALFEDDANRFRDDGFSEGVVARLNRRSLVRVLILFGASAFGFALFFFHFLKIGSFILRKIDPASLVGDPSVMGLFSTGASLVIPITVVGYVLLATFTALVQSMNRTDSAG